MLKLRRSLLRLLRLRNLVAITVILVLLYTLRNLDKLKANGSSNDSSKHSNVHPMNPIKDMFFSEKQDYFVPVSVKKIDWHDYNQIEYEIQRVGIGEHGKPAHLSKAEAALEEKLYAVNGFNGALSDKIPLNRSLPDIRHPGCKKILYIESLPTVSVVVPFHNEHWSTLLRTAFSVLYRSPEHLIKEIFLVDDASTKEFLKQKLDDYLAANMPKVSVVRLATRSGLITARLAGARRATGDVLIFLDSHTEANVNWLPPLLEPIALNHKVVVCPFIDVVAYDSFEYRAQDEGARGAFDWEFFYKRLPVLPKDEANMPEPFESPVMAGGLFAIARSYFWELGGYDPGLDIWGGEQYELSFKIWQCGGRMIDAPCSRVGHIYRKFAPFPNPNHGDFVGKNYRRVAEVWMDEYAEFLYSRRPHYRRIEAGDLTDQRALRERLQCKPFKWFMTQVAFDLTQKYPTMEPKPYAEGQVRPVHDGKLCVDGHKGPPMSELKLAPCADSGDAEQRFIFSWHKDVKSQSRGTMCWDLPDSAPRKPVLWYSCHLGGGNQQWRYHMDTKQIVHSTKNCLDFDITSRALYINRCDTDKQTQQWTVDTIHQDLMAKWDEKNDRITGPIEEFRE